MYFPKEGILIPKVVRDRRAGGMEISQYRVFLREGGLVFGTLMNVSMEMTMTGMKCRARRMFTLDGSCLAKLCEYVCILNKEFRLKVNSQM